MSNAPVVISQKKSYSATLSSNELPVVYLVGLGTQWSLLDAKWDTLYIAQFSAIPPEPHHISVFCMSCSLSVGYIFISNYYISGASVGGGLLVGSCYSLQPITYRSQGRNSKNPESRTEAEQRKTLLTWLFSTAYSACFVIRPRALAQRGHHTHQVLPHQLSIKNMSPTDLPTYQSDEDIVSAEVSSFQITLAWAKLAKPYLAQTCFDHFHHLPQLLSDPSPFPKNQNMCP